MIHLSLCFLKVYISLSPAGPQAHSLLGCVTVTLSVFLRDSSPCFVIPTFSLGQRLISFPHPYLITPSWLFQQSLLRASAEVHTAPRGKRIDVPHISCTWAGAKVQLRHWWTPGISLLFSLPQATRNVRIALIDTCGSTPNGRKGTVLDQG